VGGAKFKKMENSKQPAFAVSKEMCEMSKIETYPYGLTKREYFTAKAMQGILANGKFIEGIAYNPSIGKLSVDIADDVLSALANER